MATLEAKYAATQADGIQEKVTMALEIKALAVADPVAQPSASRALALAVLANPRSFAERFAMMIIADRDVTNPSNAVITTGLDNVWPKYAQNFSPV